MLEDDQTSPYDQLVSEYYPPDFSDSQTNSDRFKGLITNLNEFLHQPAPNSNFRVETKINVRNKEDIILKHDDGRILDMSQFLAPGYHFSPSWDLSFDSSESLAAFTVLKGEKRVEVNPNTYDYPGGILTLLHEIGHTYQQLDDLKLTTTENIRSSVEFLGSLSKLLIKSKVLHRDRYKNLKYANPEDYTNQMSLEAAPEILLNYKDKKRAKMERDAWAYAFVTARQLQRMGFNIFAGFNSIEEIVDFAHARLFTYEYVRLHRMYKRNGADEINNHTPVYIREKDLPHRD